MTRMRHYFLAACCGLLGCGANSTLNCTHASVRSAALETAKAQVRDLVLYDALGRHSLLEVALTHPKYDDFKTRTDPYVKDVMTDLDRYLLSKEFFIEAVRAQPVSKETHSASCATDFVMKSADGAKKFPIKYTSQSADDGKTIQVELTGL